MAKTAFRLLEGGDEWRKSLPERPVSENMMRWQKFYQDPCGSLCCFSPDCACIRCSNCRASLTTIPPKRRFQCMECEAQKTDTYCGQLPVTCKVCLFVADSKAWQSDFQRGMAAIAEFYKEDSGTPVEWEELMGFLKAEFQIVLTVKDTGRASDLQTAFRGALKELHPQQWLQRLIDELR